MEKQNFLYQSKGVSSNIKKFYQGFTLVYIVLGLICILIPMFYDAPTGFTVLGIFCILFAMLMPKLYSRMFQARLYIYEDHVEGVAVNCIETSPDSLFPALGELSNMNKPERLKFSVTYQEINDVQKAGAANLLPQLLLSLGNKKYVVLTKNTEKAYQILCDKVFGQNGATSCVCCGRNISAAAETCPHCGHLTRYGKSQRDQQKNHITSGKFQIAVAVGAIIAIIGLAILIPAIIDLNEISDYAGLYASIFPRKSKKMVAKVILGLFITCGGIGVMFSNWLINKLKPVR